MQKSVHKQSLPDIKKGSGKSPGNKFETSEQFHPLPTFQNGGAQFASKHATEKGFHVQIRPKRRLLLCATKKGKQEICAFPVGSVPSLCLCFGLGPAPLIFTKILKIPISLLRRLQIRVIIYLDDMLLMSQTEEELLISRDTVIFLLTHLGFVINLKKSMLNPVQKIEFLGLEIDSVAMKLSLPQRKVEKIVQMSQNALNNFEGIDPVDWEVDFNNTGNLASQTPDPIFATDADKSPKEKSCIQVSDYSGSASRGRAVMVDDKHENVQWDASINSSTRYKNIFGCIQAMLGEHFREFPQGGNGLIQRKCGT